MLYDASIFAFHFDFDYADADAIFHAFRERYAVCFFFA